MKKVGGSIQEIFVWNTDGSQFQGKEDSAILVYGPSRKQGQRPNAGLLR